MGQMQCTANYVLEETRNIINMYCSNLDQCKNMTRHSNIAQCKKFYIRGKKFYIRGKEINFSKTLAASMPIKLLPQTKSFTFGNYSTILIILIIYFPKSHATK